MGGKEKVSPSTRWLFIMILMLLAAPKMRLTIGPAPLYIIDAVIAIMAVYARRESKVKIDGPLSQLVAAYLAFVWLGELRGLITYGAVLEPIYLIGRFSLGISLFFVVPRLVKTPETVGLALKAIVAGLLCASAVTILYSLAPTRSLVMNTVLSYKFLVPEAESLARKTLYYEGIREAMRGQSLIGTSTITTGFLGVMWGFTFMAVRWSGVDGKWRMLARIAAISTPIAMLMTYGRAAWLTVIVLGSMSLIFGFAKSRRNMSVLVIILALVVFKVGWESKLFMVDRVLTTTEMAIENPYEEKSFADRLLSYTQPFSHLINHPLWLIIGAGRVGQKLSQRRDLVARLMDDAGLSKHSGFGMAYYCYGLAAAITHVLIMLSGFLLILKRLKQPPLKAPALYKATWQVFLMAWCGMLFWWLPGHAMIGEGRGVILFFFFFGFMMACDRIWSAQSDQGGR